MTLDTMMNALLKFQAQQEEQFLTHVDSTDFRQLWADHIAFFKQHLQHTFNYNQFSARTQRAKSPLHYFDDLVSYITLYGLAHYLRMQSVFEHSFPHTIFQKQTPMNARVVDYGCGQGIATLAWIEYVLTQGYSIQQLDVILIEPSAVALGRASFWIQQKAKHHDIKINITHHVCTFDELDADFLANNSNQFPCIHLFSNVLDMYANVQFSMSHLCHQIKRYADQNKQYIFAVSPNFTTGNIGFEALDQHLSARHIYLNQNGYVPVSEYNVKQGYLQQRQAPARAYAACV